MDPLTAILQWLAPFMGITNPNALSGLAGMGQLGLSAYEYEQNALWNQQLQQWLQQNQGQRQQGISQMQPFLKQQQAQELANLQTAADPTKMGNYMAAMTRPISAELSQAVTRPVMAQLQAAGLGTSPGMMANYMTQALAPYQIQEQQLGQQAGLTGLELPFNAQSPYLSYLATLGGAPGSMPIPSLTGGT